MVAGSSGELHSAHVTSSHGSSSASAPAPPTAADAPSPPWSSCTSCAIFAFFRDRQAAT